MTVLLSKIKFGAYLLCPARLSLSQQSLTQEVAEPFKTIAPGTGKPVRGHVVYVCVSSCWPIFGFSFPIPFFYTT